MLALIFTDYGLGVKISIIHVSLAVLAAQWRLLACDRRMRRLAFATCCASDLMNRELLAGVHPAFLSNLVASLLGVQPDLVAVLDEVLQTADFDNAENWVMDRVEFLGD